MPIIVNSIATINELCEVSMYQNRVIKAVLPGPVTVILKLKNSVETIAIRYSKDSFLNQLISSVDCPLYLTSANISGYEPIKSAKAAKKIFKDDVKCYINGKVQFGTPSTIIDLTSNSIKVIRQGDMTIDDINKKIGE